jgi:hypothetical protein
LTTAVFDEAEVVELRNIVQTHTGTNTASKRIDLRAWAMRLKAADGSCEQRNGAAEPSACTRGYWTCAGLPWPAGTSCPFLAASIVSALRSATVLTALAAGDWVTGAPRASATGLLGAAVSDRIGSDDAGLDA